MCDSVAGATDSCCIAEVFDVAVVVVGGVDGQTRKKIQGQGQGDKS